MIMPTNRITTLNRACTARNAGSLKLINIHLPRAAKVWSILFRFSLEKFWNDN